MTLDPQHLDLLARDSSASGRGRLLCDLTRVILVERDSDEIELEIFFDIVRNILATATASDRREFAEVAADNLSVPHDLILVLAEDEIRVAEPVLRRSVDLTDLDLVSLAETRGDDHRLAIAARVSLSSSVTEVLVRTGSAAVLHRLGVNPGAEFDDATVIELRVRAETDQELFRILIERPDLADVLARCMGGALHQIVEKSRTNHEHVVADVQRQERRTRRSPPVAKAAEPIAPAASGADLAERPELAGLLAAVRADRTKLDGAVSELADTDRQADLACLLGELTNIGESQIMRVLVRADSVGIATVARALDVGEAAYARIVELRMRRLRFSTGQARFERDHYRRVDVEEARTTINAQGGRRARA